MNKTLLQILVDECAAKLAYHDNYSVITQDSNGIISILRYSQFGDWRLVPIYHKKTATNHATAIVTKEQYEAALNQAR